MGYSRIEELSITPPVAKGLRGPGSSISLIVVSFDKCPSPLLRLGSLIALLLVHNHLARLRR
ncbi:MAG TPA: hypothetical protein ENN07_08535 [candidate division Zixibacteria bacterium]|nr:hypothetical protein [candidate division Zixibacteria bacterium]